MKRLIAVIALASCTFTALGQVYVYPLISNYTPPYNQVVWDDAIPGVGHTAVNDTSVQLTFWAASFLTEDEDLLTQVTEPFTVDLSLTLDPGAGYGPGGFYADQYLDVPVGDYLTIQLRASGNTPYGAIDEAQSRSQLYQEMTVVLALPESTVIAPPTLESSIGLTVALIPEPTTFTLLTLGSLALVMGRRQTRTGSPR